MILRPERYMRWPVLSILLFAAVLQSALAQEAVTSETPKRVTYFLIDASGSMADELEGSVPTISVGEQAEVEVSKIKARIAEGNPDALVSRTYFRARNRDLCHHSVRIASPVPILSDELQQRSYGNDFTPLGSALKSAAMAIGNQPADIFLITDGVQTSDCGPDICEIANQILPLPNVNVIPIVIGAPEDELGILACIDKAESREIQSVDSDVTEKEQAEPAGDTEATWVEHPWVQSVFQFFEHWWWLIGIVSLAYSAIGVGRRESERAQLFEDGTEDAKSLQKLIRENDSQAPSELRLLVARVKSRALDLQGTKRPIKFREVETEKMEKVRIDKLDAGVRWQRVVINYPIGSFGGLVLACIAFLPDQIFEVGLKRAKMAAWHVLDSDFATAFAVTWIAVIIFAATQHQRKREASHQFDLATREAERIAQIEQSEAMRLAFEVYEGAITNVEKIVNEFIRFADGANDDAVDQQLHDDAVLVANKLLDIAIGTRIKSSDGIESVTSETRRLSGLMQRRWTQPPVDTATLMERLEQSDKKMLGVGGWLNLRSALRSRLPDRISDAILKLAVELRSL